MTVLVRRISSRNPVDYGIYSFWSDTIAGLSYFEYSSMESFKEAIRAGVDIFTLAESEDVVRAKRGLDAILVKHVYIDDSEVYLFVVDIGLKTTKLLKLVFTVEIKEIE